MIKPPLWSRPRDRDRDTRPDAAFAMFDSFARVPSAGGGSAFLARLGAVPWFAPVT